MDVRRKLKLKKRKTHRNFDDILRKRSRSGVKNKINRISENTLQFKTITKSKNELITCQRLTLAMFKKAIKSNTVTRVPLSRVDNTDVQAQDGKEKTTTLSSSDLSPNLMKNISTIYRNDNIQFESPKADQLLRKINRMIASKSQGSSSFSYSTLDNGVMKFEESTTNQPSLKCKYISNFNSCSNSEIKFSHCHYEKFMKDLPAYIKEHFPTLTSNYFNKNVAYIRQSYLENCFQEKKVNTLNLKSTIDKQDNHKGILQNSMDYIQKQETWDQGVKKKQSILLSKSSSSSIYELGSNTSDIFLNSPDYQYFPHKLNQ